MFDLGDLSLIVLSHGRPDTTRGFDDATQSTFEEEWSKMQIELIGLSSNSQQIIAQTSGHYIQLDQPDLVVQSILGMAGPGQSGN